MSYKYSYTTEGDPDLMVEDPLHEPHLHAAVEPESSTIVQWLPLMLSLLVLVILVKLIVSSFGSGKGGRLKFKFIPFDDANACDEGIVVVDCTHPRLPTLTHHKGHNNPNGLRVSLGECVE